MTPPIIPMMTQLKSMLASDPTFMSITKENIVEKRAMFENFLTPMMATFKAGYQAYADKCVDTTFTIPVEEGKANIEIIMVKPKKQAETNQAAFVFAHGGGACVMSAKLCIDECHRYAVDWDCVCFSVDYRKGPETQCPRNQLDFMEAIDHVAANVDKYGINKDQICIGGLSGGGWIAMGAMV